MIITEVTREAPVTPSETGARPAPDRRPPPLPAAPAAPRDFTDVGRSDQGVAGQKHLFQKSSSIWIIVGVAGGMVILVAVVAFILARGGKPYGVANYRQEAANSPQNRETQTAAARYPTAAALEQHIKSVRVIIAPVGWLPRERIIKRIRGTYEPRGVKIVVTEEGDVGAIEEDAILVLTIRQQEQEFGPDKYGASYLWIDRKLEYRASTGMFSGGGYYYEMSEFGDRVLHGLDIPIILYDFRPSLKVDEITELDWIIQNGGRFVSDGGDYVVAVSERGEVVHLLDVEGGGEVVSSHKLTIEPYYGSRFIANNDALAYNGEAGLALIDAANLPQFGEPEILLKGKRVDSVAVANGCFVVLCENQVLVIRTTSGEKPEIVYRDQEETCRVVASRSGNLWLFNRGDETVRFSELNSDGEITVFAVGDASQLAGSDDYVLGEHIAVGFNEYQDSRKNSDEAAYELHVFQVADGAPPKRVSSIAGSYPAEEGVIQGDMIALRDRSLLRLFSANDPRHPLHVTDIPLGRMLHIAPAQSMSSVDFALLSHVGSFSSFLHQGNESVLAYTLGMVVVDKDGQRGSRLVGTRYVLELPSLRGLANRLQSESGEPSGVSSVRPTTERQDR